MTEPNMIADVAAFHAKFGVPVLTKPTVPSAERVMLRCGLVTEEYSELVTAMGFRPYGAIESEPPVGPVDLPETADAIADLIYVLIGTAHEFGIPLAEVWRRVQDSNMAKEGGATRPDGKVLKPQGWMAPDVAGALRQAGWVG